jgi:hypothetical protein
MDFLLVILIVGMAVSGWVVVMRRRSLHATYDETRDRLPARRRSRSGRRRRRRSSSSDEE